MLGPLTYHAIAAMTRERLRQIDAALLAKIRSPRNNPLERQVRFLARRAHELMSLPPNLPNDTTLPPFARQLSQQTVFGSIGPSFPAYAALFAPGQSWLADTIRRGNPDPNREMVLALSTDLLLEFWERSRTLINSSDSTTKAAELDKARSYVLGHACHIAADLISAPFVQSVSWRLGEPGRDQLTPAKVAEAIEFAVSKRLFGQDPPRGDAFKDWWPESGKLPLRFFDAFKDALEAKFGAGARPRQRPTFAGATRFLNPQVSTAFWKQFEIDRPVDLSVRLLEDGYASFRATLEHRYVWNKGDWLAGTALIFLPPIFAYPLIVGMPHTRAMFKDGALVNGQPVNMDKAWFGLVMAPLVTSALASPLLSIYVSAFTSFGVSKETVLGWIAGGVNLITAISFLITLNSDVDPAVRWLLLFIVPFLGLLGHAIYVLSGGSSDPRHIQLALASLVPCIITAAYVLFHLAWHRNQELGMNGWLKETDGRREEWGNLGFIGGWVLWAGLLVGSWMVVARQLQGEEAADREFVTGESHFLRLFDQSTLFFDPSLAQNPNAEERNPTLATHFFPTDRRPLLKIWWEGGGDLFMRSERHALRFSTDDEGTDADQFVLAPAAPMTLAEFARFLNSAIKEPDDATAATSEFTKKLKVELVDTDDLDYVLPPGELFSDQGDDETTIADHNTEAVKFTTLKTTRDEATVLYHAPRSRLANFVGKTATVIVDEGRRADVAGVGQASVAAGSVNVVGRVSAGVNTSFTTFFKRGDQIAIGGLAIQTRIVDSVQDDQNLTVTFPFSLAGPTAYTRKENTRDDDFGAGLISPNLATYRVVDGTDFDSTFMAGDIIRAKPGGGAPPEERIVIQVISATQLMTDKPFSGAVVAATPCERVGRATLEGSRYLPPSSIPVGIFSGDTLIDRAADLGAILAMGAVSHLLDTGERQAVGPSPLVLPEDQRPAVNRVYQVFRNWNLNQRRMNEWRMLVFGNAVSEKRGAPRDPDPTQPGVPAGWTSLTAAGEETANRVGWVPLLQKWLDVARRPGIDSLAEEAFREGDPTNRKLSEGIAFLFDLSMPPP